jgi:hypothetical protein
MKDQKCSADLNRFKDCVAGSCIRGLQKSVKNSINAATDGQYFEENSFQGILSATIFEIYQLSQKIWNLLHTSPVCD